MNPLHWSSLGTANCTTVTGRTFINPNLDTHHPHRHDGAAIATPLPYGYNTDSDIEHQHFYPASPTTVPGLTQSDALRFPKPPRQFNTEPNYYTTASTSSSTTNVGRFSAGSPPPSVPSSSEVRARFNHPTSYDIDHGATSHLAFKLPDYSSYRFPSPDGFSVSASAARGLTESGRYSPRQFISRNDNDSSNQTQAHARSWGPDMSMPFLDQATTASVTRGAQTTYQWIDPVISDSPEQVSLALASSSGGKGSYLPPSSHKSRLGTSSVTAHQITHHSPVISPSLDNLSRPQSNMTIQTRLSSTSMSTSASTSQLNNSGSGPVPITPAAVTTALASNEPVQVQAQADQDNPKPRKKHGCPMCHKSFDRPSTLRKHLLVHTGEKAFVCDICGRRFGVNSNLNRHVKRCILRNPADASPSAAPPGAEQGGGGPPTTSVPVAGLSNTSTTPGPSQKHPLHPSAIATGKRKATSSPASSQSSSSARTPTQSHAQTVGSTKRRRRPPSPTQWIPASLAFFKLLPIEVTKCASVPLPPVSPVRDPRTNELIEERDSWDENVGPAPYYKDWTGRLPGPAVGFGGKDVGNLGFPLGGEGYVMGRLVLS